MTVHILRLRSDEELRISQGCWHLIVSFLEYPRIAYSCFIIMFNSSDNFHGLYKQRNSILINCCFRWLILQQKCCNPQNKNFWFSMTKKDQRSWPMTLQTLKQSILIDSSMTLSVLKQKLRFNRVTLQTGNSLWNVQRLSRILKDVSKKLNLKH